MRQRGMRCATGTVECAPVRGVPAHGLSWSGRMASELKDMLSRRVLRARSAPDVLYPCLVAAYYCVLREDQETVP